MNNAVWHVLEKLCSGHTPMSERFAMEQAMLVAILHHHVGTEVGECNLCMCEYVCDGVMYCMRQREDLAFGATTCAT